MWSLNNLHVLILWFGKVKILFKVFLKIQVGKEESSIYIKISQNLNQWQNMARLNCILKFFQFQSKGQSSYTDKSKNLAPKKAL